MSEGRDLRNKVCYIDGYAYAMGGLHSKAERLNYSDRKWDNIQCYPLSDNLDSWASCMLFTPKLFANRQASLNEGLQILSDNQEQPELKRLPRQLTDSQRDDLEKNERLIDEELDDQIEKNVFDQELVSMLRSEPNEHALVEYFDQAEINLSSTL